jgi:hypothetical protein
MSNAITGSVGKHARNNRHDVIAVQLLLNNHITAIGPRAKLSVDGVCGQLTEEAITAYQAHVLHMAHADGVIDPRGRTLKALLEVSSIKSKAIVQQVHKVQKLQSPSHGPVANVDDVAPIPKAKVQAAAAAPHAANAAQAAAHLYTDSPLEMVKARTPVKPLDLANALQKSWSDLNWTGVLLLVAQYMGETNEKSCWNYNLGNMKCTAKMRLTHLHQYLAGTWEVFSTSKAAAEVKNNPNASYATPKQIHDKVGTEKPGTKVIFYKPPDIMCCFRAYKTLNDAVVDWTDYYKHWLNSSPDFVKTLNAGDADGFGKILVKHGYFTNASSAYISSLKRNLERLQKTLGKK